MQIQIDDAHGSHRTRCIVWLWIGVVVFFAVFPLKPTVAQSDRTVITEQFRGAARRSALASLELEVESYVTTGRDFHDEVITTIRRDLLKRRDAMAGAYDKEIAEHEAAQVALIDDAMLVLERFLTKYPDHPEHTPDAMFRLADLYFEQASMEYALAMDRYDASVRGYEQSAGGPEPVQPTLNLEKSIWLYDGVVKRFPKYRYADASMYLLGFCYERSGDGDRAISAYEQLVALHPESRYVPEAYLRIGEYFFDVFEFDRAIAAYEQAAAHKDRRLYDKAIYKLAWAHFQRYDYDRAIAAFKLLISYYDQAIADGTADGGISSALRREAVEYLARSLTEDDWNGDGVADPDAGVERALSYLKDGLSYERDILLEYAESLFQLHETAKYEQAAEVYRRIIVRDPLHPDCPQLQERIVSIYDIMGAAELSEAARIEFATRFAPNSEWRQRNSTNTMAVAKADELVEQMLRQQAQLHHQRAQELRREGRESGDTAVLARASAEYSKASLAYGVYLDGYPKSRYAPDMRFFRAETLFFSGRFLDAANEYEAVRDLVGAERYRENAAYSAIKSLESAIAIQVAEQGLDARANPQVPFNAPEAPGDTSSSGNQSTEVRRAAPLEVPPVVARWVMAVDAYVGAGLNRPDGEGVQSKLAYQAAEMLHRYKHYEESRGRFEKIIDLYPSEQLSGFAAANIINSYREENDWDNIERWTKIIDEKQLGAGEDAARLKKELRVFKLGSQFQRAEQLLANKQYLRAAREFERLVDEDQGLDVRFADKALYNAALAYEQIRYYDSASRIFERIATETRFSSSPFVEDAIFRLSENAKRFFNFTKATEGYLALVNKNHRNVQAPYALFEAARILENDRRLDDAAYHYERYGTLYEERPDAAGVLMRAARLYEKTSRSKDARRLYGVIIDRFGAMPEVSPIILEATLRLANHARDAGDQKSAAILYERVLREYSVRGIRPGTPEAAFAAEARFALIEQKYAEYEALVLRGTLDAMGRQIKRKEELLVELEEAFLEIFDYKALDWTFAAFFRVANLYDEFAKTLYGAPVPETLSEDEQEIYRVELEDIGVRYEDTAVQRYQTAVEKARELKVQNQWTLRALENLNRYKPAEYPLLKKEKRNLPFRSLGLLDPLAGPGEGVVRPVLFDTSEEELLDAPPVSEPESSSPGQAVPSAPVAPQEVQP